MSRKFLLILTVLSFVVIGGYGERACGADACKEWVTTNQACASSTSCSEHGAYCDAYQCYNGPYYYSSPTQREVWAKWPGWLTTPPKANGTPCGGYCIKYTQELQCSTCASPNKILSFTASKTEISAGEAVNFSWTYSGCVDDDGVSLTVGGMTFSGGHSATWTGADADGLNNAPKVYEAILTVSGECCGSASESIEIVVSPPPECNQCPCPDKTSYTSSVSLLTGALKQNELLFAAKGGRLVPSVSLYYDSLNPRIGPIGAKWSHSYDTGLIVNKDLSITLWDANNYSLYLLTGGVYVSSNAEAASLVKTADNTYTLSQKDGSRKRFNAAGQAMSITDRNDDTLSFTYDTVGNLISVTDDVSRTITFAYDENNRLITITDPAGKSYSFAYTDNYLSTITWPDASNWQYTYDDKGFMLSKTDPLGKVTSYTYDAKRRVVQGTTPAGTSKGLVYPTATTTVKSSQMTDENGGVWIYTYDSHHGYMTQKADPFGNTTTYSYDANRNRIRETAPDGSSTSYTYDTAGNRLTMTDALGKTTSYTYNAFGQVTRTIDPLGQITTSAYDAQGRLLNTIDPLGAKTSYTYDAKGNLLTITNPLDQTTALTYDAFGNQSSIIDPVGATTTFSYDAMGNMLTQTDAAGKTTTFAYDGRDRLRTITDPLGNVTTYAYDAKGNKTSQTDANGNVTRFEYDDMSHLVKSIDPLGGATTYTYGASGCPSCGGGADKLTSLTDAKGQTTSYQYDLLGRLVAETDPLGKTTAFTYDVAGNLATRTDANGGVITYTYDALKRLTTKSYPDGRSESYSYDAAGRPLTVANAGVTYTYGYDAGGRVASVNDSRGYRLDYAYGALGQRTRTTLQSGTAEQRLTTYSYDNAGRLTAIASPAGTFGYSYNPRGQRTTLTYPHGVVAGYSYDEAGRLTGLSHGGIASFAYSLDPVGNRTSKSGSATEAYLYDAADRLRTVTSDTPEAFSYDAVGNRETGPGAKDNGYQHDAANRMEQGRQLQYGYDDNGNQTVKIVPGATEKSWVQSWDDENRLVKMEKVKGTERRTVSFTYDPQGRRISKTLTTVINGVTKTSSWSYVYDSDNIALEIYTDETGTVTKTYYTHGAGIDEHLALERNGGFLYYHADGLGSIVAITDTAKNVAQRYEYDSFGMVTPQTDFVNSYTYTGREWDKEAGLYYYRARYYDPMDGRFVSKDPLAILGNIYNNYGKSSISQYVEAVQNAYIYTGNNPINWTDPSGLFRWHGNWGGPGWTAGQFKPESQLMPSDMNVPAIDDRDACYRGHDICIRNNSCGIKSCDHELASCLRNVSPFNANFWITSQGYPVDAVRESIGFDTFIPSIVHR